VATRFLGHGWAVTRVGDGDNLELVERALQAAATTVGRPTLVIVDSHLTTGPGPDIAGEHLQEEEVRQIKRRYQWPEEPPFFVPEVVREYFRKHLGQRGAALREEWLSRFRGYALAYRDLADELARMQHRQLPDNWDRGLPVFAPRHKGMSGRDASALVLNVLAGNIGWLLGGSADLAGPTKTRLTGAGAGDFSAANPGGRNLHFGVREHAMAAVLNGLALCKVRAYGSTFLIYSDYARPALRQSALMEIPVIYLFTHDTVGVGEDGPAHQPMEQLVALRAIPGLIVLRPADANEVVEAWRVIMQLHSEPAVLILSRQPLPILDRTRYATAAGVVRGAYVLADAPDGRPDVLLLASGSEVFLCVNAYERLKAEGIKARVVSMPSWELFELQSQEYRESVLPPEVTARVAVEQASTLGWARYVGLTGECVGMNPFGASAPLLELQTKFGFAPERVTTAAREQLAVQ
jgi:transketolase